MKNNDHSALILLGRPFLKRAKTKIDIHSGTVSMEFDGEIVVTFYGFFMDFQASLPWILFFGSVQ